MREKQAADKTIALCRSVKIQEGKPADSDAVPRYGEKDGTG